MAAEPYDVELPGMPRPEPAATWRESTVPLRERQAAAIRDGVHPLSVRLGRTIPLHRDADVDPTSKAGEGPRCGTCRLRRPGPGGVCVEQDGGRLGDVPAWWPACPIWQPLEHPFASGSNRCATCGLLPGAKRHRVVA